MFGSLGLDRDRDLPSIYMVNDWAQRFGTETVEFEQ